MRRPWESGLGLIAVLLALAACESRSPVERGFGSRQLLALRDTTLSLGNWTGNQIEFVTGEDNAGHGTPAYFTLDADTGTLVSYGSSPPPGGPDPRPPGGRFICSFNIVGDGIQLLITDPQTGVMTMIDRVYSASPGCPTDADPSLVVWRSDDAGHLTLWTGPYDALAQAPVELVVSDLLWTIAKSVAVVLAGTPDAPDALGMFTIDLGSFATGELVPASLGSSDWAVGATPEGTLASASLVVPPSFEPVQALGDHFFYQRAMSDGGTAMFVGPLTGGPTRELALYRLSAAAQILPLQMLRNPSSNARWPDPVWQLFEPGGTTLYHWRDGARELASCPLPSDTPLLAGTTSADGQRVLLAPEGQFDTARGPALLLPLDPAGAPSGCVTLATADVSSAALSPDGASMIWLVSPAGSDATLWSAGADGAGARVIGTGPIRDPPAPHYASGTEVELTLGTDLVWLDLRDDPVRMHYVAEQVSGHVLDAGDWIVAIYDYSNQDGTGRLALINRNTGAKRLISPTVSQFQAVAGTGPELSITIAYVVRGRNPSPDDGIWIATVTANDLL